MAFTIIDTGSTPNNLRCPDRCAGLRHEQDDCYLFVNDEGYEKLDYFDDETGYMRCPACLRGERIALLAMSLVTVGLEDATATKPEATPEQEGP